MPPVGVLCGALRLSLVSRGPERLRWPLTGMPCANSLRLGFASGGRCAHALQASHWCSLAPDAGSLRPGRLRARNAGDGCRLPVLGPPPHPSSVKRLPVAGSRRVLAPVMPPALWRAGVPPAAPPRPLIANALPSRPCRHSRQASSPAGLPHLPWCGGAPFIPGFPVPRSLS